MKPLVVGLATTVTCALAAPAALERRDGAYYYRPHDDSTAENKNETTKSDHDHAASDGHHYGHKYGHASTVTANVHLTHPTIWAPFANPTIIIDGETYANLDKGDDDDEIKAAIFLNGERIDEEVGGGRSDAGHQGGGKAGGKGQGGGKTIDADVSTSTSHVSHGVITKQTGTKSDKQTKDGEKDEKRHESKSGQDKSIGNSDIKKDEKSADSTSTHIKATTATTVTKPGKTGQGSSSGSGTSAHAGHDKGKGFITTVISAIFGNTTKTSTATAAAATTTIKPGASSGAKDEHKGGSEKHSGTGKGNGAGSVHVEITKHAAGVPTATPGVAGTFVGVPITKVVKGTTNASTATTTIAVKPATAHVAATIKPTTVLEKSKETQVVKGQSTEKTTLKKDGGATAVVTTKGTPLAVTKLPAIPTVTKVQTTAAPNVAATTKANVQNTVVPTAKATPAATVTVQKELTKTKVIPASSGAATSTVKVAPVKVAGPIVPASTAKASIVSEKPNVKVDIHAEVTKTPAKQTKSEATTKSVNTGGKPTATIAHADGGATAVVATKGTLPAVTKLPATPTTSKVQTTAAPKPVAATTTAKVEVHAAASTQKPVVQTAKATPAVTVQKESTKTKGIHASNGAATSTVKVVPVKVAGPIAATSPAKTTIVSQKPDVKVDIHAEVTKTPATQTKSEGTTKIVNTGGKPTTTIAHAATKTSIAVQQPAVTKPTAAAATTKVQVQITAIGGGAAKATAAAATTKVQTSQSKTTQVSSSGSTSSKTTTTVKSGSGSSAGAGAGVGVGGKGTVGSGSTSTTVTTSTGNEKGGVSAGTTVKSTTSTAPVGGIGGSIGSGGGGSKTTITTSTTTVGGGKGGVGVPSKTTTTTTTKTGGTSGSVKGSTDTKGGVSISTGTTTTTTTSKDSGKHTLVTVLSSSPSSLEALIKTSRIPSEKLKDYTALVNILTGGKAKAGDAGLWKLVIKLFGDGDGSSEGETGLHQWLELWITEHADEAKGLGSEIVNVVERVRKSSAGGKGGKVVVSGTVGVTKGGTTQVGGGKGTVSISGKVTTSTTTGAGQHTSEVKIDSTPSSLGTLIDIAKSSGSSASTIQGYSDLFGLLKEGKAKAGDAGVWKLVIKLYGDGQAREDDFLHHWLVMWIHEHADDVKGSKELSDVVERVKKSWGKGGKIVVSGSGGSTKGGVVSGGGKSGVSVSGKVTTTSGGQHTSEVSIDSTPSSLGTLIDIAKSSGSSTSTIQGYSDLFNLLKGGKVKAGDEGVWKLIVRLYGDGQASDNDFLHRWLELWIHAHADDVKGSKEFSSLVEKVQKSWGAGGKGGGKIVISGTVGGGKGAAASGGGSGKTSVSVSGKVTTSTNGDRTSEVSIDTTPSSLETLINVAKTSGSSASTIQGYSDLFNLLKSGKAKAGDEGVWKLIIKLYGDRQGQDDDFLHRWLELWIHEHGDDVKGSKEFSSVVERVKKSWATGGKAGGKIVISGSVGGGKGVAKPSGGGGKTTVSISSKVTSGNRTSEASIDATPSSLETLINIAKSSGSSASTIQGYSDLFGLLKSGKAKAGDDGVWRLVLKLYGDGQASEEDFLHRWLVMWIDEHADEVKGSKEFSSVVERVKKSWGTGGTAGGKIVISGSVRGGGKGGKTSSGGGGKTGVSVSGKVTTGTDGSRTTDISIDATPSSLETLINAAKSSGASAETLQGYTDLFSILRSGKAKAGDDGVWRLVIELYGAGQAGGDDFLRRWLELWIQEHADEAKGSTEFSDFIVKVKANANDKSRALVSGLKAILASPTISRGRLDGATDLYWLLNQAFTLQRTKTIFRRVMSLLPAQAVGDDLEKWLVRWVWSNLDLVKDSKDADIVEFVKRFRVQYADSEDASDSSDAGKEEGHESGGLLDSLASSFDTLLSDLSSSTPAEDLKSYQNLSALLKDGKTKSNDPGLWRLVLRLYNSLDSKSSAHRGLRRWLEVWIHDHADEEGIKGSKEFEDVIERVRKTWVDRDGVGFGSEDDQEDEMDGSDDLSVGNGWFDDWFREHPEDSETETGVDYRARRETYQTLVDDFSKASFELKSEDDVDEEVERWFEVWFEKHPEASWLMKWRGYDDLVRRFKRTMRRHFWRLESERESRRKEEEAEDVAAPGEGDEPEDDDGWGWLTHFGESDDQETDATPTVKTTKGTPTPTATQTTITTVAPTSTVKVIQPMKVQYELVKTSRGVQKCRVVARNVSRAAFRRSKGLKRAVGGANGRRRVSKRVVAKAGRVGRRAVHRVASEHGGRKVVHGVKTRVGNGHGGRRVLKRDGTVLMCAR